MVVKINLSPQIPSLPKLEDKAKIDVRYALISPYAFAHIYWNKGLNEVVYEIEEPILSDSDKAMLSKIEEAMLELINVNVAVEKTIEATTEYVDKTARLLISELNLKVTQESYDKIFYYLFRDFIGLNEIDPLLRDYFIEDIECNGINTPLYVIHRVYRNLRTNLKYTDIDKLASFVEKLAQRAGRYISYAQPLLDGSLPDGSLDYNEPFIYKENGVVKVSKIGKFIDSFYREGDANVPVRVENLEVPALNHDNLKVEWKKLNYVYRHKNSENLYNLELEFGRSVNLTGAHSVFVLEKDGIKSKKTSEMKEGEYAVVPLKIPENAAAKEFNLAKELSASEYCKKISLESVPESVFIERKEEITKHLKENYKKSYQAYYELKKKKILPIGLWALLTEENLRMCKIKTTSSVRIPAYLEISKELMRLLGYYIAEGWTTDVRAWKKIQFCLNKKEVNLIEDIRNCFKKCFGVEIYVEPEKNNSVKVTLNSLLVWLVFNNILKVSHYARKKEVPEIVFNVSRELQREFLKAWHAGDFGSTASRKLADDISYLSLFDGKTIPFYERDKSSVIFGREVNTHEHYTNAFRRAETNAPSMIPIEIFNPLNKTHFKFRNKKISRKRVKEILNEKRYERFASLKNASDKFLNEWQNREFIENGKLTEKGEVLMKEIELVRKILGSDLGFFRINKIERVKPSSEYVYDVSVPENESFVGGCGGVMCHNSRVNATYTKDVTSKGPTFTVRKFTKVPWTPTQLIAFNTASPEMVAYFWLLLQYKSSIMIAGGTASGKTTFLNAIAFFIPPEARVVSLEDTREINLPRENWLPAVARPAVGVGKVGEIDLFDLLKSSFRQNPDYLIVGEVRGKEASVLFQGMASGHASLSTMHADSVDTLIRRLETPPIELSPTLVNTLDCVAIATHAIVGQHETRKIREVSEIVSVNKDGSALINTPLIWDPSKDIFYFKKQSKVFDKISSRYGIPMEKLQKEFLVRARLLNELTKRKIFSFEDVYKIINDYYKNPAEVLSRYNITG
jgi:type IV secretory pathway ATPase VirB11/archaellum biosynthesis ATPase/intein/homing endonuclease